MFNVLINVIPSEIICKIVLLPFKLKLGTKDDLSDNYNQSLLGPLSKCIKMENNCACLRAYCNLPTGKLIDA